jgi:type I restriction enzyme S subunit
MSNLPNNWEWKSIEELCEILDRLRKPISQKNRISGQYPYYGATGIVDYIDDYIFDEKLLLVGEDGAKWNANENTAFIADGKYWVNNHAHIMRPNRDIVLDMILVYYLNATDLMDYITGATVKKLNQQKLKSIKIPLPPLPEQQRIVSKVDKLFKKIDKTIALHQKNMDETDVFMGSVLNDVFGELEEKYEITSLDTISTFQNGFAFKSKEFNKDGLGLRVIRIGNVLDINKNPVFIDKRKEFDKYLLKENDIVISMTGTRKKMDYLFVRVVDSNDSYLNQRVGRISSKYNSHHRYLYYYLKSNYFRDKIFEFETGTVNQGNISSKDIMNSRIPNMSINIQQKVVKYLDEISEKIEKIKSVQKVKMNNLKALKSSILDKAFRGEL